MRVICNTTTSNKNTLKMKCKFLNFILTISQIGTIVNIFYRKVSSLGLI